MHLVGDGGLELGLDILVLGQNDLAVQPRAFKAWGRAPATSARPPVFAKGTASLVTSRIFLGSFAMCDASFGWMTAFLPMTTGRCPARRGCDPGG